MKEYYFYFFTFFKLQVGLNRGKRLIFEFSFPSKIISRKTGCEWLNWKPFRSLRTAENLYDLFFSSYVLPPFTFCRLSKHWIPSNNQPLLTHRLVINSLTSSFELLLRLSCVGTAESLDDCELKSPFHRSDVSQMSTGNFPRIWWLKSTISQ